MEIAELPICIFKFVLKQYKSEEFIKSLHSFASKAREQKGCLGFNLYQDSENENKYSLIGEWKTERAMEKYFRSNEYVLLLGAARVLGETFEINITEDGETGDIGLAREQIDSKRRKGRQRRLEK
jgi:quinol monooxygenase YgiN